MSTIHSLDICPDNPEREVRDIRPQEARELNRQVCTEFVKGKLQLLDAKRGATKPKAKPAVWLLDIPPGRRVSLHITQAMAGLPKPKPERRWRLWHILAWAFLMPSGAALSAIAALALLRHGL